MHLSKYLDLSFPRTIHPITFSLFNTMCICKQCQCRRVNNLELLLKQAFRMTSCINQIIISHEFIIVVIVQITITLWKTRNTFFYDYYCLLFRFNSVRFVNDITVVVVPSCMHKGGLGFQPSLCNIGKIINYLNLINYRLLVL